MIPKKYLRLSIVLVFLSFIFVLNVNLVDPIPRWSPDCLPIENGRTLDKIGKDNVRGEIYLSTVDEKEGHLRLILKELPGDRRKVKACFVSIRGRERCTLPTEVKPEGTPDLKMGETTLSVAQANRRTIEAAFQMLGKDVPFGVLALLKTYNKKKATMKRSPYGVRNSFCMVLAQPIAVLARDVKTLFEDESTQETDYGTPLRERSEGLLRKRTPPIPVRTPTSNTTPKNTDPAKQ